MSTRRLELVVVAAEGRADHFVDPSPVDPLETDIDGDDGHVVGGHELLIAVDGVLELRRWGGLGMEPNVLLNPEMPLLPPAVGKSADVAVQRCDCGEIGCGSVVVTVSSDGTTVRWSDFRDGDRSLDIGPFDFDAVEYEAEIRRAHRDRPWESRAERIARRVANDLEPERGQRPLSFDWAASWSEHSVEVSYTSHSPNPTAGESHRLGGPGGLIAYSVEPDETSDQCIGSFSIDPTGSDDDAVRDIVEQVRTTHPRTWPRSEEAAEW